MTTTLPTSVAHRRGTAADGRPLEFLALSLDSAGLPILRSLRILEEQQKARAKRVAKQVDLIVANDVSRNDAGFDVDTNAVSLVSSNGVEEVPLQSKDGVAAKILDRVEQLLAAVPQKTSLKA